MGAENKELDDEELKDENVDNQDNQDGAGDESKKDDKGDKGNKGTEDDKSKGKVFTQEQVNRMMTREKNQGRTAAMKELGLDSKDPKMVAMVKALIESQKTDEQKGAEKEALEQAKIMEAEQRALVAEAKAEAMSLGVKSQYVDDVVALVLAKKTEDSDLKTLIGEYKTKYAFWFGTDDEEDGKDKTGKKGTGSSIKSTSKDKDDKGTQGLGARLAAQRKGTAKKSSYWS